MIVAPSDVRRARRAVALACAAVVVLAILPHIGALGNGFAYDDESLITGDERIRSLANVGHILTEGYWADPELSLYRPLTTISFAVNHVIGGTTPAIYHATNLMLHAVVSVLVLLLLRRFVPLAAAAAGAALFAVHPVHVEAVANVAGRGELLAALLVLAACLLHDGRARWLLPPIYLLALLAKESAVVLPALLVLVDAARGAVRPGTVGVWARRQASMAAALGGVFIAYLLLRHNALGAIAPSRVDPALELAAGIVPRVLTALQAWPHFLRLLLWPATLLADYGPAIIMPAGTPDARVISGALILGALIAGSLYALRHSHYTALLAAGWFLVAIAPVSNFAIPIGVIVAERTLYLPSIALAIAAALAFAAVRPALQLAARGILIAAVLLGAVRSAVRVPEWHSTETIFAALLRDRPDSFRAHWVHARYARSEARSEDALASYARAVELWPHRQRLVMEAAAFGAAEGRTRWAQQLARHAVQSWPDDVDAARLLAATSLDLGDAVAARNAVDSGMRIAPADPLLLRMAAAVRELEEQ